MHLLNRELKVEKIVAKRGSVAVHQIRPIVEWESHTSRIMKYAGKSKDNLIIFGYFNAHCLTHVAAKELVVHNRGNKPTFVKKTSESNLDITLSDEKDAEKIKHWEVLDEETLADHRYITFKIMAWQQTRNTQETYQRR